MEIPKLSKKSLFHQIKRQQGKIRRLQLCDSKEPRREIEQRCKVPYYEEKHEKAYQYARQIYIAIVLLRMNHVKQPLNLEKLNRRYSMPNSLRGSKISSVDFNRTRSLKLQKVKQPKTARSHFEPFQTQTQSFAEDGDSPIHKPFFATHTRILRGKPSERRRPDSDFGLMMEPPFAEEEEVEEQKREPSRESRLYFYSANLQQKMNIYLNSLLNRSQEDHKQKLKQIETKILVPPPALKPYNHIQNQFWRKMRRYKSVKKEEVLKEGSSWEFKIVNK